ncbi:annexin A13-like [Ptychodera flava]|uniref:annexin A13-like n=1 Tax=Ptychodera flava TaxID=63121 RepID=UPI00396A22CC
MEPDPGGLDKMGCGASSSSSGASSAQAGFQPQTQNQAAGGQTKGKHVTNTDVDVGRLGPIQVARQPFAPPGSPAIYHGTVLPLLNFDPTKSAERIKAAIEGAGTNDDQLIQEIAIVTNVQRQAIKNAYQQRYGKDLINDVKGDISGDYEEVILHLLEPSAEYDSWLINECISGPGTDEDVLLEILCFRTKEELAELRRVYQQKYGRTLEEDIKGDTTGDFEKLLLTLLQGNRDLPHIVVEAFARSDAKLMYEEGEGRLGTDDDRFIDIFTTRSWDQLAAATFMYEKMYGKKIEDMLESEFSFDMLAALKKLVVFARDRAAYFAERLYSAMKGLGTDDDYLQRIVITRCEVDLLEIKEAFRQKYGLPLSKMIRDDTSYNYKEVLLALVN